MHNGPGRELRVARAQSEPIKLLRTAIEQTRLLRLRYRKRDWIVEPHDYGKRNSVIKLLLYQIGAASSGSLAKWRWRSPNEIEQTSQMGQALPQSQTD